MKIRTRFAPSPTGYLHVGGARTALYCYLFARKMGGEFILRIEDTDLERSTQDSIDAILEGMAWLGLDYDEGPYYQTKRMDRYREVIQQWLHEGKAYKCYCSKERLERLRDDQIANKAKPRYDGHCRHLIQEQTGPFVVRFKNPEAGEVTFHDLVHGDITFSNDELDDLIIARSDGSPTYNFTVIVDDYDMKITHVIRGDDHINNTPRQINMLKALHAHLPIYAHVPMILGDDGKRLSKRHGAVSVIQYAELGILPEALLNYLVRLGWSHGDQEIFSREEMVKFFSLEKLNKSAASFNTEKLLWVNQHYLKTLPIDHIIPALQYAFEKAGVNTEEGPTLTKVISGLRERVKTVAEMVEKSLCFFKPEITYEPDAAAQYLKVDTLPILRHLFEEFETVFTWDAIQLHQVVKKAMETLGLKMPQIAQPLRVALVGNTTSPPIDITLELVGRERCLARLKEAIVFCTGSQ